VDDAEEIELTIANGDDFINDLHGGTAVDFFVQMIHGITLVWLKCEFGVSRL
jgi:hypothetical protein